jgi:hypothetical protein
MPHWAKGMSTLSYIKSIIRNLFKTFMQGTPKIVIASLQHFVTRRLDGYICKSNFRLTFKYLVCVSSTFLNGIAPQMYKDIYSKMGIFLHMAALILEYSGLQSIIAADITLRLTFGKNFMANVACLLQRCRMKLDYQFF